MPISDRYAAYKTPRIMVAVSMSRTSVASFRLLAELDLFTTLFDGSSKGAVLFIIQ